MVGDMFDKDKAEKSHYHYRYVCCIRSRSTNNSEGVKNLLSSEESNKSLGLAINSWKIRGELADKIGKGKYTLTEYEKIKRITMPLGDKYLLYVTTDNNFLRAIS
jgi:hypothetical protein